VTFVYAFAKIGHKEERGEQEGHLTYLWLIVMILLLMLYGLYIWVSTLTNDRKPPGEVLMEERCSIALAIAKHGCLGR
jgi:hypothetical protein